MRFVQGHYLKKHPTSGSRHPNWKGGITTDSRGATLVHLPQHHRANESGYVFQHVMFAEATLGRPVPGGAEIHHVNGDPGDNRNHNLVICQDRQYHALLHQRERSYKATGRADYRKCWRCKNYDHPSRMQRRSGDNVFFHPECQRRYLERRRRRLH